MKLIIGICVYAGFSGSLGTLAMVAVQVLDSLGLIPAYAYAYYFLR